MVRIAGAVALVLLLDVAAGAFLTGSGWLLPEDRGDIEQAVEYSITETMSAAPIAEEPWAEDYAAAMQRFELDGGPYVPFLSRSFVPFRSEHINVTERGRVSYRPPARPGRPALRVAVLGGSVIFGVGQRDEHTIPSELARLAEAEGLVLDVHNYGLPTWVSWQEQLYFERMLARGERYDMVVFLDGFNEFEAQRTDYSAEPTHVAARWMDGLMADFRRERAVTPGALDGVQELIESYRRNSALWRSADSLTGRRELLKGGRPLEGSTPAQQSDAAIDLYGRSVRRIQEIAATNDVPVRFFWQPQADGWPPSVLRRLPAVTTSLADVFDGLEDEVYIDQVHTNEAGARIIAEALWDSIGPELARLARG